jgi:hypothetical protein
LNSRPPVPQTGGDAQHRHFKSRSKRAPATTFSLMNSEAQASPAAAFVSRAQGLQREAMAEHFLRDAATAIEGQIVRKSLQPAHLPDLTACGCASGMGPSPILAVPESAKMDGSSPASGGSSSTACATRTAAVRRRVVCARDSSHLRECSATIPPICLPSSATGRSDSLASRKACPTPYDDRTHVARLRTNPTAGRSNPRSAATRESRGENHGPTVPQILAA